MKVSRTVRSGGKGGKQRYTRLRPYLSLFILLPDTGKESSEALEKMIREVNSTQVAPEDVLSDTLYRYDSSQGRVVMV